MSFASKGSEILIVTEVLIGIGLSVAFVIVTFNSGNEFWGNDYLTGLLRFYGGMSIIFFTSVFSVGIIGAMRSRQSRRIGSAILYAFGFWLLSLIATAVSADFLRLFSAYFMLVGITYGFNYGLSRKAQNQCEGTLE